MTYDLDDLEDSYVPRRDDIFDRQPTHRGDLRQSGVGIASFAVAIFSGITALALIVIAALMESSTPGGMDEESPQAIIVGLGIFGVFALNLLGVGLGFAGLIIPDRLRTFAVLGLIFNILVTLGLGGLMVIGLTMGA